MKRNAIAIVCMLAASAASAKLPALSDDAKAKAAEAAARTAHGNKVADFQLCKSMNRTAAFYVDSAKKANKETKPATPTPDCADPGPFVYPPPAPAAAPPAAAAPAPAPAAAGAAPPKKP